MRDHYSPDPILRIPYTGKFNPYRVLFGAADAASWIAKLRTNTNNNNRER